MTVRIVGVGNPDRGDDAAGPLAARRCRGADLVEIGGDGTALLEVFPGATLVVVIDAMRSGAEPGTVARFDAAAGPIPAAAFGGPSTHAIGVAGAVELARSLGLLPPRLVVIGVEGRDFAPGTAPSAAVAAGIERAAAMAEAEACTNTR